MQRHNQIPLPDNHEWRMQQNKKLQEWKDEGKEMRKIIEKLKQRMWEITNQMTPLQKEFNQLQSTIQMHENQVKLGDEQICRIQSGLDQEWSERQQRQHSIFPYRQSQYGDQCPPRYACYNPTVFLM